MMGSIFDSIKKNQIKPPLATLKPTALQNVGHINYEKVDQSIFFQALRRASAEFTEIKRLFTYFYFNNWIKKEQQGWCLELISSPFFELKSIIQGHADKVHIWETLIHIALFVHSIQILKFSIRVILLIDSLPACLLGVIFHFYSFSNLLISKIL